MYIQTNYHQHTTMTIGLFEKFNNIPRPSRSHPPCPQAVPGLPQARIKGNHLPSSKETYIAMDLEFYDPLSQVSINIGT